MTHPLPCECHECHLPGLQPEQRQSRTRSGFLSVLELQAELSRRAVERQHLSGIHPPGGRVPPTEPVRFAIAKPGGIGPPPTEVQQRWAAARDDRMPDETDMVHQPDAA